MKHSKKIARINFKWKSICWFTVYSRHKNWQEINLRDRMGDGTSTLHCTGLLQKLSYEFAQHSVFRMICFQHYLWFSFSILFSLIFQRCWTRMAAPQMIECYQLSFRWTRSRDKMPLILSQATYQNILNWLWNDSWTNHLLMAAKWLYDTV